ncbi:MAG: hypothetical protein GX826_01520 [Gammaproteobacteria bacterium]|nr:hypothetical protein [Gammaproteobacteria bacterium]
MTGGGGIVQRIGDGLLARTQVGARRFRCGGGCAADRITSSNGGILEAFLGFVQVTDGSGGGFDRISRRVLRLLAHLRLSRG